MPRPRLKKQELVLIGLPTLLILGGAAFFARQQTIREQDSSGAYRAEITGVEVLPVSPFEAWQGFDTKVIVSVKDLGQLKVPAGLKLFDTKHLEQNVILTGRVNGQAKSFPVSSKDFGNGFEPQHPGVLRALMLPRSEELKDTITFLAATSGFDSDSPVQLRGELWIRKIASAPLSTTSAPPNWTLKKNMWEALLETHSKIANLSQTLPQGQTANIDLTAPPVEKVRYDLLSPVYAHTGMTGDNGSGFVHIDFKPNSFSNKYPLLRSTAAEVFDESGRVVPLKGSGGFKAYKTVGWDMNTRPVSAVVRLPLEDVPLERGRLTMKVWFAIEDGWPILVESEVRPAWMSKRPRTLQLQKLTVEAGHVIAMVHYSGIAPLRPEGELNYQPSNRHLFFDGRDDTNVKLIPNVPYKRLYTYWSQHYTLPSGKSYWFPNSVDIQSIDCDATNNCRIDYKTNALNVLKPGQSAQFSAHIGVEGDGFLPIHAKITRPLK
ncbi:hypothetical protein EON83_03255 [bacterium]|nr:MAG: hypothetical protein EON83_03255 [bacterium]